MSESLQEFRVAVLATENGQFAFQIFAVCSEPKTLLTDSRRYMTPAAAAQAGYEAIASMRSPRHARAAGTGKRLGSQFP